MGNWLSSIACNEHAERARDRKARLAALQQEQLFSLQEAELEKSLLEFEHDTIR